MVPFNSDTNGWINFGCKKLCPPGSPVEILIATFPFNFFLNVNGKLMDSGKITIGNNVFIAPNVCIITEEHAMDVEQRVAGLEYTHPVTIGDNVWICTGALILPGVTIGEGSIIGAGSVVAKDIPPKCLAVGNPCKVIRKL